MAKTKYVIAFTDEERNALNRIIEKRSFSTTLRARIEINRE